MIVSHNQDQDLSKRQRLIRGFFLSAVYFLFLSYYFLHHHHPPLADLNFIPDQETTSFFYHEKEQCPVCIHYAGQEAVFFTIKIIQFDTVRPFFLLFHIFNFSSDNSLSVSPRAPPYGDADPSA